VHAPFGVDNSHGVADRQCKAAERKLKALFAPPRRPRPPHPAAPPPAPLHPGRWRAHPACRPRPPARPAARRSAVPRDWGWTGGAGGGRIAPQRMVNKLTMPVTELGGMSLRRVLVCPMYTPQVAHRSCLRAWSAVATQRISLCRCAPCSALKAGSPVMRWTGTLGARGLQLQRPRAGVSSMALQRHPEAKARLQEVVPG
jgi:hypothetical protein